MHIVARNTNKDMKVARMTPRQEVAVARIKALIKSPRLSEWKKQHLRALLDLPLN